jgi:hypothetical protein
MPTPKGPRLSSLSASLLLGLLAASPGDRALVPPGLQVDLVAKVLQYDRNFVAREAKPVAVLVVYAPDSPESERVAKQFMTALQALEKFGGAPHTQELVPFANPAALAALVKARAASVVIFAPGLASQAEAVATAFNGLSCLTISSTPEGVREGLVLGFDLVSGRARMLFNLSQSRRQRADFQADVLRLMTVYP